MSPNPDTSTACRRVHVHSTAILQSRFDQLLSKTMWWHTARRYRLRCPCKIGTESEPRPGSTPERRGRYRIQAACPSQPKLDYLIVHTIVYWQENASDGFGVAWGAIHSRYKGPGAHFPSFLPSGPRMNHSRRGTWADTACSFDSRAVTTGLAYRAATKSRA